MDERSKKTPLLSSERIHVLGSLSSIIGLILTIILMSIPKSIIETQFFVLLYWSFMFYVLFVIYSYSKGLLRFLLSFGFYALIPYLVQFIYLTFVNPMLTEHQQTMLEPSFEYEYYSVFYLILFFIMLGFFPSLFFKQ